MSISGKKCLSLAKISISDKNVYFWQKCLFLANMFISGKNVYFWQKMFISEKMSISGKRGLLLKKCLFQTTKFDFLKKRFGSEEMLGKCRSCFFSKKKNDDF